MIHSFFYEKMSKDYLSIIINYVPCLLFRSSFDTLGPVVGKFKMLVNNSFRFEMYIFQIHVH